MYYICRAEFEKIANTLKDVISQRDKLKLQVDELKDIIRAQKSEKKALLKQVLNLFSQFYKNKNCIYSLN